MRYGSQVALLALLLGLPWGESIHGVGNLAGGRREATTTTTALERRSTTTPPPCRSIGFSVPRRGRHQRASSMALGAGAVALRLRGGSDATNAENVLEQQDVEGKVDGSPDHRGDERAMPQGEGADGKPHIETLYMQSGEESEVVGSPTEGSMMPRHEAESRPPQPQPQELPSRGVPPTRLDKVAMPADSSFVQSPSQLRAFVKRRGPPRQQGGGAAGGAALPQPNSPALAAADGSTATPTSDATIKPDTEIETTAASGRAAKPVHALVAPMINLFVGIVRGLSHPALLYYGAALLGTSVGFAQFLYFSTVGYATGIALPVAFSLLANPSRLLSSANLPSLMVLLWGIRLAAFLLWREYLSWPALHSHMRHVKAPPLVPTQLLGWVVYSGLYLCVASPVLFRQHPMRNATSTASMSQQRGKASASALLRPSRLGLALQIAGLLLEATADVQKSLFKAQYRHDWCNVGLWKYGTHPHYVGEAVFWVGTHLGGLSNLINCRHHRSPLSMLGQLVTSGAGLSFVLLVLRGAVSHSHDAQLRKYGTDPTFVAFQETYGLFGYRLWRHSIRPALRRAMASPVIDAMEETS